MASCFVVQGICMKTAYTDGRVLDLGASYAIIKDAVVGAATDLTKMPGNR